MTAELPDVLEERATPSEPVILLAEDEEEHLSFIIRLLQRTGRHYRFLEARDGASAQQKAKEAHPDLIVMDLMMPETAGEPIRDDEGLRVVAKLRADPETANIPVVVLTIRGDRRDLVSEMGLPYFRKWREVDDFASMIESLTFGLREAPAVR